MKMNKITNVVLGITILGGTTYAQNPAPAMYAESLRKGPTHITQDKFEIKLTADNANYKQRVRDSTGTERYELAITAKVPEGDTKITSWQMSLRDLRHGIYGNLLQFDQELSEEPRDNLFWLNPSRFAPVPIRAKRIIKVDAFYVVFQVKDLRFNPLDSPYLESITVQVELTNSDPRGAAQ